MKELAFTIAQKIASDRSSKSILICASILKDAFQSEGISEKDANVMAIDTIKIIMKSMLNISKL
jgi:hypothetical protein